MKNLFFIHRFPFNKEAYIRDEFEFLLEQGFNVKYLDISSLLKKRALETSCPKSIEHCVISFSSKKAFRQFILLNSSNSLLITDVGLLANSAWMFLSVFKAKLPYVLFENAVLPNLASKNKSLIPTDRLGKIIKRINIKKVLTKPREYVQFLLAKQKKYPAKLVITSKPRLSSEKRNLVPKSQELKYASTLDYKIALATPEKRIIAEKYAVFIDQYFIHHPDFKTNYIVHNFTAEQYYSELNQFLREYTEKTGLKIVIAAHPRRNKQQTSDFDHSFPIYYNKTAELVKHSEIVLHHFSTAINYIVIFNKPFELLTSPIFNKSTVEEGINMFSSYFSVKSIDMQDGIHLTSSAPKTPQINKEIYQSFFDKYIKHPKATNNTFREMILEVIDSLQ